MAISGNALIEPRVAFEEVDDAGEFTESSQYVGKEVCVTLAWYAVRRPGG